MGVSARDAPAVLCVPDMKAFWPFTLPSARSAKASGCQYARASVLEIHTVVVEVDGDVGLALGLALVDGDLLDERQYIWEWRRSQHTFFMSMVCTSSLPALFFTWNSKTALVCTGQSVCMLSQSGPTFFWRSFFSLSGIEEMPSAICLKYWFDLNSLILQ